MSNPVQFIPEDCFEIIGRGTIITGKLISGTIKAGMEADLEGSKVKVKDIESLRKSWRKIDASFDGAQNLGLLLTPEITKEAVRNCILNRIPINFEETAESLALDAEPLEIQDERKSPGLKIITCLIVGLGVALLIYLALRKG